MKKHHLVFLFFCLFNLFAVAGTFKVPTPPPIKRSVTVASPGGTLFTSSSVHFTATAQSTCPKGVSGMGIYTGPYQSAYRVRGSKLDTTLTLPAGNYDTVVQQWDNCGGVVKKH